MSFNGGRRKSEHPDDTLRRLEERLDRASDAAERLIAEAAAAAPARSSDPATDGDAEATGRPATGGPPPAGWQVPVRPAAPPGGDLELLVQVVQALRELIPPELQRRLLEALRELLLAVRALIDWYLERNERRRSEPSQVQDIPIT